MINRTIIARKIYSTKGAKPREQIFPDRDTLTLMWLGLKPVVTTIPCFSLSASGVFFHENSNKYDNTPSQRLAFSLPSSSPA